MFVCDPVYEDNGIGGWDPVPGVVKRIIVHCTWYKGYKRNTWQAASWQKLLMLNILVNRAQSYYEIAKKNFLLTLIWSTYMTKMYVKLKESFFIIYSYS